MHVMQLVEFEHFSHGTRHFSHLPSMVAKELDTKKEKFFN